MTLELQPDTVPTDAAQHERPASRPVFVLKQEEGRVLVLSRIGLPLFRNDRKRRFNCLA